MSVQSLQEKNDLSVSVINISSLLGGGRIDAEYYGPVYLAAQELCSKKDNALLGELIELITDYHANGSYETLNKNVQMTDEQDYALMIRTTDLENNNYHNGVKYISENAYNFLKKTKISGGEIIINKIGSAGRPYLMPFLDKPVSLGMNQFLLRIATEKINNYYLYAYLKSKYGERLLNQKVTGAVPLSIDKKSVKDVLVPIPSKHFQNLIHDKIARYQELIVLAPAKYRAVTDLFLEKINLLDYKMREDSISVKTLAESIEVNRFDAEYWQPKFQDLDERVAHIRQAELGQIVELQKGIEPGSEAYELEGKPFIRVSDFTIYGIGNVEKKITEELYKNLNKNYSPEAGEVLFTKDGTIGISYALHEDYEGILSGAFLRLIPQISINIDYLALVLNSNYCKAQIERMSGGAIIAHLKPDDVKRIKIPLLSSSEQSEIAEQVKEALKLRNEALSLLEKAKTAVELFIESDEKTALEFLGE